MSQETTVPTITIRPDLFCQPQMHIEKEKMRPSLVGCKAWVMAQGCSAGFPAALAEQEVEMGAEKSMICCKSSSKEKGWQGEPSNSKHPRLRN